MADSAPKRELTRAEVAQRLRCSVATIQRFEREGELTPRRDKPEGYVHGRVWFDSDEVEALARRWRPRRALPERANSRLVEQNVRGRVAARIFQLLRERAGQGREEVFRICVIETQADPMLVRELIVEWDLGVEKARELELKNKREAEEKETQKQHEKRDREEKFRQWKLKLAAIEAKKT